MKSVIAAVVIGGGLAALAVALPGRLSAAFIVVSIIIAICVGAIGKKLPGQASLTAAAIAFGMTAIWGVAMIAKADGSSESCEVICFSQSGERTLLAFAFTAATFVAAGASAAIAAIILKLGRRTEHAP